MAHTVAEPCVNVKDHACVEQCPVECFYEGVDQLYIHPDECIDCGACEPACPVSAIFAEADVPESEQEFTRINALWFEDATAARRLVEAFRQPGAGATATKGASA